MSRINREEYLMELQGKSSEEVLPKLVSDLKRPTSVILGYVDILTDPAMSMELDENSRKQLLIYIQNSAKEVYEILTAMAYFRK